MKGQWITCPGCDAPWVTGRFHAQNPQTGTVAISGLGFFELYINGKRVSDEVLSPVWTDYGVRDGQAFRYPLNDQMSHRVCYCRWDLKDILTDGENEVRVLLGNGWYSQRDRRAEGVMQYGDAPILWFELNWTDETGAHALVSDELLTWHPSNITYNNVYFGETQDLRLADDAPRPVQLAKAPEGELQQADCPPDRILRRIAPKLISETNGVRIYDAGETMTGWAALNVCGDAGAEVIIRYADMLDAEGNLDFSSGSSRQIQIDRYISSGKPEFCRPHFTWHAFRYLSVEGNAADIILEEVHSDVKVTGAFECDNENINHIVNAYLRTRLDNMHCGVPSDCPHRERLGYTGDGQAIAMTDMYFLDADKFYRKWIQDIFDGQDPVTGHVQHTAPFYGGGGGPGGWGGAVVLVPWAHYERYGDKEFLKTAFPHMEKWVYYMLSRMDERGAVVREEPRGWCLGDWCAPEPVVIPEAYVNTCYLDRCLSIMIKIAEILEIDSAFIRKTLADVHATIRELWWDGMHYAGGIQGADALALEAGLGDHELAARMAAHYREEPWFDTGFLATGSVIRELCRYGYYDEAFALLDSVKPEHSFGWQRLMGADTLWERWDGRESRNHPMFGGVTENLMRYFAGIPLSGELIFSPHFPEKLRFVNASAVTKMGKVALSWKRTDGKIMVKTDLPAPGQLKIGEKTIPVPSGRTETLI